MKIVISEPEGPYETIVDPGVMDVTIHDPHIGVRIRNGNDEEICVSARDDGFEILYKGRLFDAGWFSFQRGEVITDGQYL